jgi:hypothetical protein
MSSDNIPEQFLDATITPNPELINMASTIGELGIDELLEIDGLTQIPLLGVLVGSAKVAKGFRERWLIEKIVMFLANLKEISEEEKIKFKEKIDSDPKYKKRVADTLMTVLDNLDDIDKAEMLAKTFTCFLQAKIEFADFRRICYAINTAYADDLKEVCSEGFSFESLASTGLVTSSVSTNTVLGGETVTPSYNLTRIGFLFKYIMTDDWTDAAQKWKSTGIK